MNKSTNQCIVIKIDSVCKHFNADKLEIIQHDGFQTIIQKRSFNIGDLAVFIPPDSLVDTTRPEFSFLADGKKDIQRIKVKKLRGIISMGLLVPAPTGSKEGDDVAEILGVGHYEPELSFTQQDENVSAPSGYHPRYDIDSLRKHVNVFKEGERVFVSEKIHGCLHGDSLVKTPYGDIRISDIDIGQEILSYNIQSKKFVIDSVIDKFVTKDEDDWVKIELEDGKKLICTESHKILTKQGFKRAIDITENDEIIIY